MNKGIEIFRKYYPANLRFLSMVLILAGILFAYLGAWSIHEANDEYYQALTRHDNLDHYRRDEARYGSARLSEYVRERMATLESEIATLEAQAGYFSTFGSLFLGLFRA